MEDLKKQPHWWWPESRNRQRHSSWLQSTLQELDKKTKAMLKLIEEDADSFAQRAEMYYKKRPELISMVEEFYRAHRSLAERYDQVKPDSGSRRMATLGSPFFITKCQSDKSMCVIDRHSDCYSETYDPEEEEAESAESDVDDPVQEDEAQANDVGDLGVPHGTETDEMRALREEMERLKEENMYQKDQLMQKDEQKREVIRQLCLAVEALKEENFKLKSLVADVSQKKHNCTNPSTSKLGFMGKLFNGLLKN